MQFDKQRIQYLLNKVSQKKATRDEEAELLEWYHSIDFPEAGWLDETADHEQLLKEAYQKLVYKLNHRQSQPGARIRRILAIASAAAILVLIAGICAKYFYLPKEKEKKETVLHDAAPGHTGAILTLADGSTVLLDSSGNGTIATQGNVEVTNTNGQLAYSGHSTAVVYNTLSTPRARQYSIILPDGTKVWLNAASSIKYPLAFTGKERKVTVTGEAYFEVAHNDAQPFKVAIGHTEITDIGTHFNVYGYEDEPVLKTTLLEGAVKVNSTLLEPGEQALVSENESVKVVRLPDAAEAIAWKNGLISFGSEDFPALLRQIGRWYNIDVEIKGDITKDKITGAIPRNTNLSSVIKVLEMYGLKCTYQAGKLSVSQ